MGAFELAVSLFSDGLIALRSEIALFAAIWIVVGILDEVAIDACFLWLWLRGHRRSACLPEEFGQAPLKGTAAVFIPTWQESVVIGFTLRQACQGWRHADLRIYVGCYRNDAETIAAVLDAAGTDPRVRLVIHDRPGPTTKADCLNRLYAALCDDEQRTGTTARCVILHDAEDMVHPAALQVIDDALDQVDFVQLPVRPEPDPGSRWIAGHYIDEFTEAHAKLLVVRSALGQAIPAAGVGCGFARPALAALARQRSFTGEAGPFAAECLTEDYELGLLISAQGRRAAFLRLRDSTGALVATRSYFPGELEPAVRQKTRWIHGIAFQAWERMGWAGQPFEVWMALRDRRGPLTALVLAAAYAVLVADGLVWLLYLGGVARPPALDPLVWNLLLFTLFGLLWRATLRGLFVSREYGAIEGLRAILRIPIGNIIAIMAGRRAVLAYLRSLRGEALQWDKTQHVQHPAAASGRPRVSAPA